MLNEMSTSKLPNKGLKKELNEKYRIQKTGLNYIIDDVKQRVKAKAHKIQRYTNRNKKYTSRTNYSKQIRNACSTS